MNERSEANASGNSEPSVDEAQEDIELSDGTAEHVVGGGKVQVSDMSLQKISDKASP